MSKINVRYPIYGEIQAIEIAQNSMNAKPYTRIGNKYQDPITATNCIVSSVQDCKERTVLNSNTMFDVAGIKAIFMQLDAISDYIFRILKLEEELEADAEELSVISQINYNVSTMIQVAKCVISQYDENNKLNDYIGELRQIKDGLIM